MRKLFNLFFLLVLALVLIFGPTIRVEAENPQFDYYTAWQDGGQPEEQAPPVVVVENQTNFDAIWILVAALAGILVGGGGATVILARANASKPLKDSVEELLAKSIPPEYVNAIHNLAQGSQQITGFMVGQFKYAGVPGPIAAAIQEGALVAQQAADFVESVTDGETNNIPASFQASKGVPPIR